MSKTCESCGTSFEGKAMAMSKVRTDYESATLTLCGRCYTRTHPLSPSYDKELENRLTGLLNAKLLLHAKDGVRP